MDCVETARLQATVTSQRRHLEDLNQQLQEALAAKQQLYQALAARSPAASAKQVLTTTALRDASTISSLRAKRTALSASKAALTAQLAELIRSTEDNRLQHVALCRIMQQLARQIGVPQLQSPMEQAAAVAAFVWQAQRDTQVLQAQVEQYEQLAAAAAPTAAQVVAVSKASTYRSLQVRVPNGPDQPNAAPCSPADGVHLDQTATSRLVYSTASPADLFQTLKDPSTRFRASASLQCKGILQNCDWPRSWPLTSPISGIDSDEGFGCSLLHRQCQPRAAQMALGSVAGGLHLQPEFFLAADSLWPSPGVSAVVAAAAAPGCLPLPLATDSNADAQAMWLPKLLHHARSLVAS